MGRKISEDIIEQIPILYDQLKNKTKVAEQLHISPTTVNKYLTIYNGAPPEVVKKSRQRVKVDEELISKINEKYFECRNITQVARELEISTSTVRRHLTDENLKLKDKQLDDRDALWYYIIRLFGVESDDKPVSDWNLLQMQKFNKMGMSYRAQLLTLKWYYEIENNPVIEKYHTIGIIPYIFTRAGEYYKKQAKRQKEIEIALDKQLEQDRIEIKYNPNDYIGQRKKKKQIDLNSIIR